jgi:hypothetical protein
MLNHSRLCFLRIFSEVAYRVYFIYSYNYLLMKIINKFVDYLAYHISFGVITKISVDD